MRLVAHRERKNIADVLKYINIAPPPVNPSTYLPELRYTNGREPVRRRQHDAHAPGVLGEQGFGEAEEGARRPRAPRGVLPHVLLGDVPGHHQRVSGALFAIFELTDRVPIINNHPPPPSTIAKQEHRHGRRVLAPRVLKPAVAMSVRGSRERCLWKKVHI